LGKKNKVMRRQSAKNKLKELVTDIKAPERKIIFINEGEEIPPKTCDEIRTVIIFTDFKKKNEKALENKKS
jgi:hypothetical protein